MKDKGELEIEQAEIINKEESMEIKSKFVNSNVLTVEIPKKCKDYIFFN